jgi:hypothetical protein
MRVPRPDNPALEKLLDERDHIRVQISLLHDAEERDAKALKDLQERLVALEREIRRHKQVY